MGRSQHTNPKFGEPVDAWNSASDADCPAVRAIFASESPLTSEIRSVRRVERLFEFRVGAFIAIRA